MIVIIPAKKLANMSTLVYSLVSPNEYELGLKKNTLSGILQSMKVGANKYNLQGNSSMGSVLTQ